MDTSLIFVGAVVSLVVQFLKTRWGTDRVGSLAVVLGLSALAGALSWYFKYNGLWDSFLQILTSSAAVYAFIVKNAEIGLAKFNKR